MNSRFFLIALSFFSFFQFNILLAQIVFEPAYFIKEEGEKITGFIKNEDWNNNPETFEFKSTIEGEIKTYSIRSVSEFEIIDQLKYVRAEVEVEQTSDTRSRLTGSMVPELKSDTVFLKVLLEGDASLFELKRPINRRYYFKIGDEPIQLLIYKKFMLNSNTIRMNSEYQKQITSNLTCNLPDYKKISKIKYTKRDLKSEFLRHNLCLNSEVIVYKVNKKNFGVSIGPRLFNSSNKIESETPNKRADFGSLSNISFYIKAEFFLPFRNDQWSIISGITHQSFNSNTTTDRGNVNFKHSGIIIPVGIRYNHYFENKMRLFTNASIVVPIFNYTQVDYDYRNSASDIHSKLNLIYGIGLVLNEKIEAELEYEPSRQLFALATSFETHYKTLSFSLRYKLPLN